MIELRTLAIERDDLVTKRDDEPESFDADDKARLAALDGLAADLGGDLHVAANRGVTLIEDGREWRDYAETFAEDVFNIDCSRWPFTCIDWDDAACELAADYTTVTFDGDDYYVIE